MAGRNTDYIQLSSTFTADITIAGFVLGLLPPFLKPLVAPFINPMARTVRRAMPHLAPVIKERRERLNAESHAWDDGPNNVLQWLIKDAMARKDRTDADIVESLFLVNLGATHNTSNSLTHTLYHLAESPQYLSTLREEIEPLIAAEGWTANAFNKMEKLDSFLAECQRYTGVGMTSIIRKTAKDITLNDGTKVPRGTFVQLASPSMHRNEEYYENPEAFDPFRFAMIREKEGIKGSKYQVSTTTSAYLPFGHGPHACPGRFLAAYQMKTVLAYVAMNYDMKFDGDGRRPPNFHFAFNVLPALDGRVMFRARRFDERDSPRRPV